MDKKAQKKIRVKRTVKGEIHQGDHRIKKEYKKGVYDPDEQLLHWVATGDDCVEEVMVAGRKETPLKTEEPE